MHLIVTGLTGNTTCLGSKHAWSGNWIERLETCECLEHVWGRFWKEITGDSYIVAVRKVWNLPGAVHYMSKYLTKTFLNRGELEAMGFLRRWSCSRNWPRTDLGIAGAGTWKKTEMLSGAFAESMLTQLLPYSDVHPMLVKTGNDTALAVSAFFEEADAMRRMKKLRGVLNENV